MVAFDQQLSLRVLPDTCVELFINYGGVPLADFKASEHIIYKGSIITSRMSAFMDVTMRTGTKCMAICFKPGQAWRFFDLPMASLSDKVVELESAWKQPCKDIEENLANACNDQQRVEMTQAHLLSMLNSRKADEHISISLDLIHSYDGALPVKELVQQCNISHRQLSRKFHQFVGLSPKEYLNMVRFTRSLKLLNVIPPLSLTEVSYEGGYYDQAHFIRACKRYTGTTPGRIASIKNH